MRIKKILAAAGALSMTASTLLGTAAFHVSAADQTLKFDIRSGESNDITISAEDIAAGDYTVPVNIYIPENPGVNGIQLKMQINDGQVAEDGSFGNYGLYFSDAALASPCCFDTSNADPAFPNSFTTPSKMNLTWTTGLDKVNADASAEEGTSAWDSSVSWAYDAAFMTANLVVPQNTPAGDYTLDIRKEQFVNALSSDSGTPRYGKSVCTSYNQTSDVAFESVPLTVHVAAADDNNWQDSYEIEGAGHYLIAGDICGAPGETVHVPIYVFNDTGTAGMQLFFKYDQKLKMTGFTDPMDNYAYLIEPQGTPEVFPASFTFATSENLLPENGNGSILTYLDFVIPENAEDGTVYDVGFYTAGSPYNIKIIDRLTTKLNVALYDGSITVLSDNSTALNRTSLNFTEAGETANLTLFNAPGSVTWSSSDETVAKVDQNGFVTAVGNGNATITASNNGNEYTCSVSVGCLFGDVDMNGDVSSSDAQLTLMHFLEVMNGNEGLLSDAQIAIADVDGDGSISAYDAQCILSYFLEYTVSANTEITWYEITQNPNAPGAP